MVFDYPRRATGDEWMDNFDITDVRLLRALIELPRLNRLLGGYRSARIAMREFLRTADGPVEVLDIGTGIGDLPVRMVRWAESAGRAMTVTATDANPVTVQAARNYTAARTTKIRCEVADAMALPYADASFDVATASQVLHHFSDEQALRVLREMIRVARRMVIVSDLHRNRLAWLGIHVVSRVLGCGPMIRADGPLSVRKGFVRADLEALAVQGGLRGDAGSRSESHSEIDSEIDSEIHSEIRWHPMFRWGLVARRLNP